MTHKPSCTCEVCALTRAQAGDRPPEHVNRLGYRSATVGNWPPLGLNSMTNRIMPVDTFMRYHPASRSRSRFDD